MARPIAEVDLGVTGSPIFSGCPIYIGSPLALGCPFGSSYSKRIRHCWVTVPVLWVTRMAYKNCAMARPCSLGVYRQLAHLVLLVVRSDTVRYMVKVVLFMLGSPVYAGCLSTGGSPVLFCVYQR